MGLAFASTGEDPIPAILFFPKLSLPTQFGKTAQSQYCKIFQATKIKTPFRGEALVPTGLLSGEASGWPLSAGRF